MRKLFVTLLALVPVALSAATVTLAWDPSPSDGVIGYRVYWGLTPAAMTSVTQVSFCEATVSGLDNGTYYCFTATAIDFLGQESGQATPVCTTTPIDLVITMIPGYARLVYLAAPGLHPVLWRSGDLSVWRKVGTMSETSPGYYRRDDRMSVKRFYRVSR